MYYRTARSPQPGPQFDRLRVIRLRRIQIEINIKTIVNPITTIGFQINRGRITTPAETGITAIIANMVTAADSRTRTANTTTTASLRRPDSLPEIMEIHPRGWSCRGGSRASSTTPYPTSASSGRRKMDTGAVTIKEETSSPKTNTATDTETKMETMPDRKRVIKTAINAQRTNARPTAAATTIRTTTASATARCAPNPDWASSRVSFDNPKPPRLARVPESPAAHRGTRVLFPAATNGPSTPRARLFPLTGPAPGRPRCRSH